MFGVSESMAKYVARFVWGTIMMLVVSVQLLRGQTVSEETWILLAGLVAGDRIIDGFISAVAVNRNGKD